MASMVMYEKITRRISSAFLGSAALILLIAAAAKLYSTFGTARVLERGAKGTKGSVRGNAVFAGSVPS